MVSWVDDDPPVGQCTSCGRVRLVVELATFELTVDMSEFELALPPDPIRRRYCAAKPQCQAKARESAAVQAQRMREAHGELTRLVGEAKRLDLANVVELPPRDEREPIVCPCGGWWFDLAPRQGRPGAVTLDVQGRVTGWHGEPKCIECGKPAQFPQPLPVS